MPVPSAPQFDAELSTETTVYEPHYAQIPQAFLPSAPPQFHAPIPVAIPVAIPVSEPVPGQAFLASVPQVPTEAELSERVLSSGQVDFQMSRYLHEGWMFLKHNLCVFLLAQLAWAFIFFLFFLVSMLTVNHFYPAPAHDHNNEHDAGARHGRMSMTNPRFILTAVLLFLNTILIATPCMASWFIAVFNALRTNSHIKFGDFFAAFACNYYFRIVGLGLVMAILSHVLALLLYFPAIWFAIATMFAVPLHREHPSLGIFKSMKFSVQVVHRHFCTFLGFTLVLVLLQVVGFLCLFVGLLLTIPLAHITVCYAYHYLIGINGVAIYAPALQQVQVAPQQQ
jgi:uncharacterized membrane protein